MKAITANHFNWNVDAIFTGDYLVHAFKYMCAIFECAFFPCMDRVLSTDYVSSKLSISVACFFPLFLSAYLFETSSCL